MKKLMATWVISALGTASVFAADMTTQERADLRERAAVLQAERTQNGGQVRPDAKLAPNRAGMRHNDKHTGVHKVKKTKKAKKSKHTARAKSHTQHRT